MYGLTDLKAGTVVVMRIEHIMPMLVIQIGDSYAPIATPSWHKEVDGYITHPATQEYRDNWLPDCRGGEIIQGSKARTLISDWLSTADLSPLDDLDAIEAQDDLCISLQAVLDKL